jgi:putative phage-type endonuclease
MLTRANMQAREGRITASRAAAILGLSPYSTPYHAWLELHGSGPSWSGNSATDRGHRLEPVVIDYALDALGGDPMDWACQRGEVATADHPEHPWLCATPDYVSGDGTWLVEAKTTSQYWTEVPNHVRIQCMVQMACTGAERVHVSALVRGDFVLFPAIERDMHAELELITALDLWRRTHESTPPPITWGETTPAQVFAWLRPTGESAPKPADEAADQLVELYRELSAQAKFYAAELDSCRARIAAWLGDAKWAKGETWKISVTSNGRLSVK